MNVVGKIMVILVMVTSLAFMSYAVILYSGEQNYKELIENQQEASNKPLGVIAKIRSVEEENKKLTDEKLKLVNAIAFEKEERRKRLSQLEAEKVALNKKVTELVRERATLDTTERENAEKLAELHEKLKEKRAEEAAIRAKREKTNEERAQVFSSSVQATNEIHQLKLEIDRLNARMRPVDEQLQRVRELNTAE